MSQSCFFWDKIGQAKSLDLRSESFIWRSENRTTSGYHEIASSSLVYSLIYSRKKELLFWLAQGLNRLTCDPSGQGNLKVIWDVKNSYKLCTRYGITLGTQVGTFSVWFGYLTLWHRNEFEISRDHFEFFRLQGIFQAEHEILKGFVTLRNIVNLQFVAEVGAEVVGDVSRSALVF